MDLSDPPGWGRDGWIANVLLALLLLAVLQLHLLLGLFVGLAAFTLHQLLLRGAGRMAAPRYRQAVALVAFWLLLAAIVALAVGVTQSLHLESPGEMLARLTRLLTRALDSLRAAMPTWVTDHVPASIEAAKEQAMAWMREHGDKLRGWSTGALRGTAHALLGTLIGLLASMHVGSGRSGAHAAGALPVAPRFLHAWCDSLARLATAFRAVVGSQARISAINPVLTAVYLFGLAPLIAGRVPPLADLLVGLTFVAGMIPVVGNLLSNSAVVLSSLVVSPALAAASLAYLVGVHKLEYVLNARLIGGRIRARTYELLTALVLFEAVFGLPGVVAAPIYYAWLSAGLRQARWI
jgi:predicted PurR-regulated permease PerM